MPPPDREAERRGAGVEDQVGLVVADSHPAFAEGLAVLLAAEDDFAVAGVAYDCHRVVELAGHHQPDVLLLDVQLADGDLAAALLAVKAASPATRVLLLSDSAGDGTLAATTGADGVLPKDGSSRQVASAIRRAALGSQDVVVAAPRPPHRDADLELLRARTLSGRERTVLGLLAKGWSTRRIAQELHVSVQTVRTHVQNVLTKLGVHSKLEAVAFAFRHGMLVPDEGAPRDRHSA
jgi:two-component system nitrate/nitrite response regulator NarL